MTTLQIQKKKVIFSRNVWNELKNSPYFSELIEDIEDRAELEEAILEHKKSGRGMINIDDYLKKPQRKKPRH